MAFKVRTISFTRLLATYTSHDIPVKIFVDLILDGEIQVYCDKKNGNFKNFQFLTSDIREFVIAYLRGDEDLLTYEEMEREFGLGESLVRQLVNEGAVEDRKINVGGRRIQFVPRESLGRWLAVYVTLKMILIPGHGRVTNKTLEKVGVKSVMQPNRLGGAHWYLRKDVMMARDLLCRRP
jgi:hypothetical protein